METPGGNMDGSGGGTGESGDTGESMGDVDGDEWSATVCGKRRASTWGGRKTAWPRSRRTVLSLIHI